jgi:hypothetical protein
MAKKSTPKKISKKLQDELNNSVVIPSSPKAKDFTRLAKSLGYSNDIAKNIQTEKSFNRLFEISKTIRSREAGKSIYQNTYGRKGSKKSEIKTETNTHKEQEILKKELATFKGYKGKAKENYIKETSKVPVKDLLNEKVVGTIEKKSERYTRQDTIQEKRKEQRSKNRKKNYRMFNKVSKKTGGRPKTKAEIDGILAKMKPEYQEFHARMVKMAVDYNRALGLDDHSSMGYSYAHKVLVKGMTRHEAIKLIKSKSRASSALPLSVVSSKGSPP